MTTPTGTDFASELTGANRDAFVALNSLFTSYGLGTLAPKIFSYIQKATARTRSRCYSRTPPSTRPASRATRHARRRDLRY